MLNGASKCMLTPPPRVLGKGTKNPRDPISAQRIGTLPKEDPVARSVMFADTDAVVPCHVLAERIMLLADHSQTGSYEVLVHDAPEGAGPPPHSHPRDEAFFVVVDGEVDYASPTARILGITSGEGAAAMFRAMDRECGATPDMNRLVAVLTRHRTELARQGG